METRGEPGHHNVGRDTLVISREAHEAMIAHCRREWPREACGWLAGPDGEPLRAVRAYPMTNVAPEPVTRYAMEPREQFAVMRAMREAGEQLVAIYHSHPNSSPVPSETDIDLAYTKGAVYLIVSLADAEPTWRAWWLDCDTRRVEEVTVVVGPAGTSSAPADVASTVDLPPTSDSRGG